MNKLVVITGGSQGIGKAICLRFLAEGYQVVTCARKLDALEALKNSLDQTLKDQLIIKSCDLSKKEEVKSFSDFVLSLNQKIEVLVNNTGVFIPGELRLEEDNALETMIETNLYSAYYLTKYLLPNLVEQKSGHVFNICSVASIMAYKNGGSYSISKFAQYGMTKVLREELKEFGIRVTAVLPGATFTASWAGVDIPEDRFMDPNDVAESVFSAFSLSPRSVVEDIVIRPQLGDL